MCYESILFHAFRGHDRFFPLIKSPMSYLGPSHGNDANDVRRSAILQISSPRTNNDLDNLYNLQ